MKKSKTKLLYSLLIIVTIINLINTILNNKINFKYDLDTRYIDGIITDYEIDGNKLKIELKTKNKILGNYYIKDENELKLLKKQIKLGIKIKITGNIEQIPENRNFNLFNYRNYLYSKKIYYLFKIDNIIILKKENFIYKIKNEMKERSNKLNKYVNLFIFGYNSLEEDIKSSFRQNGISHLFAISGMHITLFTTILLKLFKKFNYKVSNILIIIFLLFYMFLTNYTVSVMRAGLLFISLFLKKIFKLNISNLNIMIILICLFLLYNPYYIYNVGFLFSFLISFSLILFSKIINKYNNYFIKILVTSYISFLISIPILINNFNEINLLAPFINIIFVPLISIIIFPLSLLVFIFPFLNNILNIITYILEFISTALSKINILTITLCHINYLIFILYYILILFIIKKININKKYIFILIIVLLIHTNINYLNYNPIITMIDVGQGDSILIELPHNKGNILIDTGGITNYNKDWQKKKKEYSIVNSVTIPYLKSVGIKKIDYLILTHGDYDHCGEVFNLLNNFKISNIIMNSGYNNSIEADLLKYKPLQVSKYELNIDEYTFNFINNLDSSNENEDSLIIYTKLNNKNILLMGDAGSTSEEYILNNLKIPKIDILKVGHHGSKYSSSSNFINQIKPDISLISAGIDNKFGHPNIETIDALNSVNSNVFVTNKIGMIKLIIGNEIKIKTRFFSTLT